MYVVSINGKKEEVEAKGLTVESGMLIFFSNEECTESNFIVTAGKWDYIEVKGDSTPLVVRKPKAQEEAPKDAAAEK